VSFGEWAGIHLKRWWPLYALIAVSMVVSLAMLAKAEQKEFRKAALANPQIMADNYELIATIGDCKVYQLISQKYVKITICETSNASMAAY